MAHNSTYTGVQVDAAVAKHFLLEGQGGAISANTLTTRLNDYVTKTEANNYLTKTEAATIYAAKNSFINTNGAYSIVRAPTGGYTFDASNVTRTLTTTITSHGRPVFITITGDLNPLEANSHWIQIILQRNGTELCRQICQSNANSMNVPFGISYLDITEAGEKTYSCVFQRGAGNFTLAESDAQRPVFCVFEI